MLKPWDLETRFSELFFRPLVLEDLLRTITAVSSVASPTSYTRSIKASFCRDKFLTKVALLIGQLLHGAPNNESDLDKGATYYSFPGKVTDWRFYFLFFQETRKTENMRWGHITLTRTATQHGSQPCKENEDR